MTRPRRLRNYLLASFVRVGAVGLIFVGSLAAVAEVAGPAVGPFGLFLVLAYGWLLYAYLRYQHERQDELRFVLSAAVDANVPLAPAVRAYTSEGPRHAFWQRAVGLALWPVLGWFRPGWGWGESFDRRAARLAAAIESGASLPAALRQERGLVPSDVVLAVAVGEQTGTLAEALRGAERPRLAAAWLEAAPRLIYPFLLLFFVSGVMAFLMTSILPRFRRIFAEFDAPLPHTTETLHRTWESTVGPFPLTTLVMGGVFWAVVALAASPTLRWYLPPLSRMTRWDVQGRVLWLLGLMTAAGRTAPSALRLLADADGVGAPARVRLADAAAAVERGEPLADALTAADLLPRSMAPLVRAAGDTRTLPWALGELGDLLAARAVRRVRRLTLVLSPLLVAGVGLLVGFVVVGIFLPLVQLLLRLSE